MKITKVEALISSTVPSRFVYAKITTSNGLVGYGEVAPAGGPDVVATSIKTLGRAIMGMDPMDTRHASYTMHNTFRTWAPEDRMRAVGAIDTALHDIKGKALKMPVYHLLGGRFREKLRLYCHLLLKPDQAVAEATPEVLAEAAVRQVKQGFTALKFDPFSTVFRQEAMKAGTFDKPGYLKVPQGMNYPRKLATRAVAMVKAVREAIGPEIDLMLDIHGRFDVESAIRIGRLLEPYDLFFYEEPIPSANLELLAYVRQRVNIPICTGERHYTTEDFIRLFQANAADIIMPDVKTSGGVTWLKLVAEIAHTYYVPIAPHVVYSSPLNAVISGHVMTTVPNFLIHENMGPQRMELLKDLITPRILPENGYLVIPDRPGFGVELNEDNLDKAYDIRSVGLAPSSAWTLTKIT